MSAKIENLESEINEEEIKPLEEVIVEGDDLDEETEDGSGEDTEESSDGDIANSDEEVFSLEAESPTDEDDELDEEEIAKAPKWAKNLRKQTAIQSKKNKEQNEKIKELQAIVDSKNVPAVDETAPVLGKRPNVEDYEYDAEAFNVALDKWIEQKQKVDAYSSKIRNVEEKAKEEWKTKENRYYELKSKLRSDSVSEEEINEYEKKALSILSDSQQRVIVEDCDNPALVIANLGKYPEKLREFAGNKKLISFAVAVAKFETKVGDKRERKRKAPSPEVIPKSTSTSKGVSAEEQRLEREAVKTGNRTKLINYRQKQRIKGK